MIVKLLLTSGIACLLFLWRSYKNLLLLCCCCIGTTTVGQVDFRKIEQEILDDFKILKEAYLNGNPERQQIFGNKVKHQMMFVLLQEGSYYHPFLRLQQYVKIVESQDKKIRVFSWNGMAQGNWQKSYAIAQFRDVKNQARFQILSDGQQVVENYHDVCIEAIYQLPNSQNKGIYYAMVGRGSHAKEQEHMVVRLFYFAHNELLECTYCFEELENQWLIKGTFQYPIDLSYDARRQQFRYLKPTYDPITGKRQDGKYHKLYWRNGQFIED